MLGVELTQNLTLKHFFLQRACAGLGVSGDVVSALWLDLYSGQPSSHVWIYHLWGPTWSFWPQHHQGDSVLRCLQSLIRLGVQS